MAPARGWSLASGNTRSFVGNALGGVRGWSDLASWVVAGSLAYYLWVGPARELQKEQKVSIRIFFYPILSASSCGTSWSSNLVSMKYGRKIINFVRCITRW
ncbi:hypothetical protein PR202_gb00199 [Eleusine coracana subsp. coracana]|uniref:Uncharacterized protein n=1 Tax=Eleusine coracana subsp. coracana TaxID=191504 RepID=A0AAV5DTA9_ELECO|nr:hypothetical protein PR202_gb00199 [Eleusine coracana subsp. coracana]